MSLLKLSHQVTQCHPAWQEDWRVRSETASSLLLLHRHFSHHHLSVAGRRWTGISPERGETWLSRLPSVRPGLGFFSTPSPGSKDRPQKGCGVSPPSRILAKGIWAAFLYSARARRGCAAVGGVSPGWAVFLWRSGVRVIIRHISFEEPPLFVRSPRSLSAGWAFPCDVAA